MSSQTRRVLKIESKVPYSTTIYEWLQLRSISLTKFVESSRKYERAYLAWEAVRKVRNPFFVDGTGFEGYFVGQCLSPEEIAEQLIKIGRHMLMSNYRLYKFNPLFRSRLLKTLFAEKTDPPAMEVLAAQFGAALGRLRCNLLTNIHTRYFQAETYQNTSSLPIIRYTQGDFSIEQEYALPCAGLHTTPHWNLSLEASLKPCDADACLVIKSIGKFGHPLIREYLGRRNSP
jgi:hypothetical protein